MHCLDQGALLKLSIGIEYLRKLGVKIAEKVDKHHISVRKETLTLLGIVITNQKLYSAISAYLINHPNDGERMVIGHLQSREIFVPR